MDYYFYDYDHSTYDDDEGVIFKMSEKSFSEVWTNCVHPSFLQITLYIEKLLIWNIICRIGWVLLRDTRFKTSVHIISIICGINVLIQTIGTTALYICAFGLISYALLFILHFLKTDRIGFIFGISCLIGLAVCELMQMNAKLWHQIRGTQMVATMKAISLVFDSDTKKIDKLPNILAYLGYLLCPASSVIGPWISFDEYLKAFVGPKYELKWIMWTITNTSMAVLFLILSNCFTGMLVSDYSWKWLIACRDALAFRCSHYFISFLSQATMSVAGLSPQRSVATGDESILFGQFVSKPLIIEFPRSLVQVVVNWNIPMHRWLKDYIFRRMKPYGTTIAIFTTYLASSLLHGLNLQLYAVLLSLGFYTFVEYSLRHKLANVFNACILASNCKRNCSHEYKWNSPLVLLVNIIFGVIAIVHLAYLGVMFEASTSLQEEGYSIEHTLSKWKHLNFISHWVAIFFYFFYLLI